MVRDSSPAKLRPWSELTFEVEAKARTVVRPTLYFVGMRKNRSFEFNKCSLEGARVLAKAWVELMQHLADVRVEAKTPLRGWKTRCDRARVLVVHAAVPVLNAKVLKRVEISNAKSRRCGAAATGSTQACGAGCPADGRYEKKRPLGLCFFTVRVT